MKLMKLNTSAFDPTRPLAPACGLHGPAPVSRRAFLAGLPLVLAACKTTNDAAPVTRLDAMPPTANAVYAKMYAAIPTERFPIPAVDASRLKPQYLRQQVDYATAEHVGTLVVETSGPFLYLVQEGGKALRYGVGVGRQGFEWDGRGTIPMKREWPTWTPPPEMITRQPELERYRHGMEPGLRNPLGARALYIFQDGRDTLYRIHGTNEPWSIGKSVSSGCIRLLNHDIIDLHQRVPRGTTVVVRPHSSQPLA